MSERASRAARHYEVRPLRESDADELGALHVRCWRETYTGLVRPERLARLDPQERAAVWRTAARDPGGRSVPQAGGPVRNHVAVERATGALAGFVTVGPARDADAPTPTELWAIYLLARHHGTGAADLMIQQALGGRPASLWVLDGNGRAIAWYRRQGFVPDGTRRWEEDLGAAELRMVRTDAPGRDAGAPVTAAGTDSAP